MSDGAAPAHEPALEIDGTLEGDGNLPVLVLAWAQRAATVRSQGMDPIADGTADRWFTKAFQNREPGTVRPIVDRLRQVTPEGYAGCCDAIGAMVQRAAIASVTAPTLVIA